MRYTFTALFIIFFIQAFSQPGYVPPKTTYRLEALRFENKSVEPYYDLILKEPIAKFCLTHNGGYHIYYSYNSFVLDTAENRYEPSELNNCNVLQYGMDAPRYYWFLQREPVQGLASYNDFITTPTIDSLKKVARRQPQVNCTRVITPEGDTAFVYITIKLDPKAGNYNATLMGYLMMTSLHRYDISLAADYYQQPQSTTINIDGIKKGTYFFNWWDKEDSLHLYLTHINQIKAISNAKHWDGDDKITFSPQEALLLNIKASVLNVKDSTFVNLSLHEAVEIIRKAYRRECNKIVSLGYGDLTQYNNGLLDPIRFTIATKAVNSHKISDKAISPQMFRYYLNTDSTACPPEAKTMLKAFD